jgi:hypothetical protein
MLKLNTGGKAGRMRWLGGDPKFEGFAMNLVITHMVVVKDDLPIGEYVR